MSDSLNDDFTLQAEMNRQEEQVRYVIVTVSQHDGGDPWLRRGRYITPQQKENLRQQMRDHKIEGLS